ncbi:hypothetical protein KBC59_01480 [Patescibacteria group bacterium]|nr:hypothetical protein [Patescibacteria group bacterium]
MRIVFLMTCVLIGCGGASASDSDLPRSSHCRSDESTRLCHVRLSQEFRSKSLALKAIPLEKIELQRQLTQRNSQVTTVTVPSVVTSVAEDPVQPAPWSEGDGVSLE